MLPTASVKLKWGLLIALLFSITAMTSAKPLVLNNEVFGKDSAAEQNARKARPFAIAALANRKSFLPVLRAHMDAPALTASHAVVLDRLTGEVFFAKKADETVPIASLTKLMAALVLLDLPTQFNKEVAIAPEDLRGGVPEFLIPGEVVTRQDLWNLMLIASSNTALAALIRDVGFTDNEFLHRMQDKANDLFLFEVNFADVIGLNSETVASARNSAKLSRIAFSRDEISMTTKKSSYEFVTRNTHRIVHVDSTNWLLHSALNEKPFEIIGGKTGYLDESKYNLSLDVKKENHDIIVVVLGSESKEKRFEDAGNLVRWAFLNYEWPNS